MPPDIWFCGDTHGHFGHLLEAVRERRPAAVVLLGDLQPARPLEEELAEILALTEIAWIPGNHDTDTERDYDHLFGSALADRNLHGRTLTLAGVRIGGLGGVFRERVWLPPTAPVYSDANEYLRVAGKGNRWRGGLPLKQRSTIFADAYHRLASMPADVLVTHEAPSPHPHGHDAVSLLAAAMGVSHLFHGHTHDALDYSGASASLGFAVFGVGLCGITALDGIQIVPGNLDAARSNRKVLE